jgi:hypothetical protein
VFLLPGKKKERNMHKDVKIQDVGSSAGRSLHYIESDGFSLISYFVSLFSDLIKADFRASLTE